MMASKSRPCSPLGGACPHLPGIGCTRETPPYNPLMDESVQGNRYGRTLVAHLPLLFLLASLLVALAVLSVRNLYDDEITSADLLRVPTRQIIEYANSGDVHPPGMYVLAHLGYQVIASPRWVALFPLSCLYVGLGVFVLAVAPLFRGALPRVCFLLFATFHPQLFMWGNSIRWYPWWVGIALIAVTVTLQPRTRERAALSTPRALAVGLLAGGLFYLNYITIVFCAALAVAMVFRYRWQAWRQFMVASGSALLLTLPQLSAFWTVHLAGSRGQRTNPFFSAARLAESLLGSEAYLPWHPLAIAMVLLFLALTIAGLRAGLRWVRRDDHGIADENRGSLASVLLFSLALLAFVAVSGLGGKPRSGLLLVPVLAPAVALALGALRSRAAQYAVLCMMTIWSGVGIFHLLRREGLAKAGMNNRPEEVLHFIQNSRGTGCSVVVTYDPILTFYLVESRLPRLVVLTFVQNSMYQDAAAFRAADCRSMELYVVESSTGGFGNNQELLREQLQQAARFIQSPIETHSFSLDPGAAVERRLLHEASALPDYRYVVLSGGLAAADLNRLEDHLPLFLVADGRSAPRLP